MGMMLQSMMGSGGQGGQGSQQLMSLFQQIFPMLQQYMQQQPGGNGSQSPPGPQPYNGLPTAPTGGQPPTAPNPQPFNGLPPALTNPANTGVTQLPIVDSSIGNGMRQIDPRMGQFGNNPRTSDGGASTGDMNPFTSAFGQQINGQDTPRTGKNFV